MTVVAVGTLSTCTTWRGQLHFGLTFIASGVNGDGRHVSLLQADPEEKWDRL